MTSEDEGRVLSVSAQAQVFSTLQAKLDYESPEAAGPQHGWENGTWNTHLKGEPGKGEPHGKLFCLLVWK